MPRLNKQQTIYLIAGAAILIGLIFSYKALAALAVLLYAEPPQKKRREAIQDLVVDTERDANISARAEQATVKAKTEAGKQAANEVDSFIDQEW